MHMLMDVLTYMDEDILYREGDHQYNTYIYMYTYVKIYIINIKQALYGYIYVYVGWYTYACVMLVYIGASERCVVN